MAVADKVLLMLDQATIIFGATGDVMTEANLEALYGIPVCAARLGKGERDEAAFVPLFRQRDRKAKLL
jgi:iron complex transport system ATP-binding protein